ncbi:MAG: phosphatase PAP2 family protein [Candidatus Kerfeldbacteria bacterium]|nr:phosphatase PAP2 family protein [Candidatus Kerfeldbacteria bacterium]
MAIVFVLSPLPLRFIDDSLWFIFFKRIGVSWFILAVIHILWKIIHTTRPAIGTIVRDSFLFSSRVWLVFYLTLVIHLNIKINVGVWNSANYDAALQYSDQWLRWLIDAVLWWHPLIDQYIDSAAWYTTVYEFMFLLSFAVFSLKSPALFHKVFCATVISLLLGTFGYLLFPAIGPFVYELPASPLLQQAMPLMYYQYDLYTASAGANYTASYLVQGLAAMPSLHVAQVAVFTYYIWKHLKPLSVLYIPMTTFIILEALYTHYHYAADIAAGLLVAASAIVITHSIYARYSRTVL